MRHAFNQKGINSLFQKLDAHYTPCSRIETLYHQYLFKKRMFHKIFFIFIIGATIDMALARIQSLPEEPAMSNNVRNST